MHKNKKGLTMENKCSCEIAEIEEMDSDYIQSVSAICSVCEKSVDINNYILVRKDSKNVDRISIMKLAEKLKSEKYNSINEVNRDIEKIISICKKQGKKMKNNDSINIEKQITVCK